MAAIRAASIWGGKAAVTRAAKRSGHRQGSSWHCFCRLDSGGASGGWCAADHLLQPRRVLPAAAGKGVVNDGQQHNQQLAHGRRLARQVTLARVLRAVPVVCEATGGPQKRA
jgi:hypothetical protein